MKKIILIYCLFIVIAACEKKNNPLIGQKAYNFILKDVSEQSKRLSDFKNQKILLHFLHGTDKRLGGDHIAQP